MRIEHSPGNAAAGVAPPGVVGRPGSESDWRRVALPGRGLPMVHTIAGRTRRPQSRGE